MIELITSRHFPRDPAPHQVQGAKSLLKKNQYGLFWEPRLRKTSAVLAAAGALFDAEMLDYLVVVSPAQVKEVWIDKKIGEIWQQRWLGNIGVHDYCSKWEHCTPELNFNYQQCIVSTSFEFLRQEDAQGNFPKVEVLAAQLKNKRVWLVIDEGEGIANPKALQTKACFKLRSTAQRITVLDGTPDGNSPLGYFTKFGIMSKDILGFKAYHQFVDAHTQYIKKKFKGARFATKVITDYVNLDQLQEKAKPFCEVLKQEDVYGDDMVKPVNAFERVRLTENTWRIYKDLRDRLVAEIDNGQVQINNSAARMMRLAQVCSGFVGGFTAGVDFGFGEMSEVIIAKETIELSSETTDAAVKWFGDRLNRDPKFKCIVWCRFTSEIERLVKRLAIFGERIMIAQSWSKVKSGTALLHPANDTYDGSVVLVAQPQANQYGLNFSKALDEFWLSRDYNKVTFEQASARYKAPDGKPRFSTSVLVDGPQGQRTITYDIVKSIVEKIDIGKRTTEHWRKVLTED